MKPLALFVSLFALAACGHDHGIAGNWNLESPKDARINHVEFEAGGKRAQLGVVSDKPVHEHVMFEYAETAGSVVLRGSWEGKPVEWTGKLVGEDFVLQGPAGAITFHRGEHKH